MVYIESWDAFETAAEDMYMANPMNCRYTMKYIHSKNHLLVKITDNVKVFIISLYLYTKYLEMLL